MNRKKSLYCKVRLYGNKIDMQNDFKEFKPNAKQHFKTLGVHCAYEKLNISSSGMEKILPETGTVFLCKEHCGAGIATHEIMHAVLYAYSRKNKKPQYPIVINNMKEEESLLQEYTFAVSHFYNWYWKVEAKL